MAKAENVYTSTGITGLWSNPASWTSGISPSSGTDTELIFGGSGPFGATFTDDIGSGTFDLNEIQLDSAATGAETIAANAPANTLTFLSNSLSAAPEILQSGSGSFLISNNLVLANTLTVAGQGSGALSLSGAISGAGGLTFSGASLVTLSGANSYTGVTTINSGVLSVSLLSIEGTGTTGSTLSGIGESNNAAANLVLNGGTLQYTARRPAPIASLPSAARRNAGCQRLRRDLVHQHRLNRFCHAERAGHAHPDRNQHRRQYASRHAGK